MGRIGRWLRCIGSGAIALALLAGPVNAVTRHVAGGNRPGSDGTSKTNAYGTLTLANTAARANDRILVYPALYAGPAVGLIAPDSAGSSAGQIYFHGVNEAGTVNTGNTTVINGDLTLNSPYTTITNFHITGNLTLGENADFCRVSSCTIDGNLYINGADYSTVFNNTINGRYFRVAVDNTVCNRDTIAGNTFTGLGGGYGDGVNYPIMLGVGTSAGVDSCLFLFNTKYITSQLPCTGQPGCSPNNEYWTEIIRLSTDNTFRGENTIVTAPAGTNYIRRLRDASKGNRFEVDNLTATGAGSAEVWMASSGNAGTAFPADNDLDSCYYNFMGAGSSRGLFWHTVPNNTNITFTTVLGRANAFVAHGGRGTNVLNHNTFVSEGAGGVVRFPFIDQAFTGANAMTFTNNIVALNAPFTLNDPISPYGSDGSGIRCGLYFNSATLDSADKQDVQVVCVSNNNLYTYWGSVVTVGDRSIVVKYPNSVIYSLPGDNKAIEAKFNQLDSLSVFGSAQFDGGGPDSVTSTIFDKTIGTLSMARGTGSGASDVGSTAYLTTNQGGLLDVDKQSIVFYSGFADSVTLTFLSRGAGFIGIDPADRSRVSDAELNGFALPAGITVTDTPNVPAAQSYVLDAFGGAAPNKTITFKYNGLTTSTFGSIAWFIVNDSRWPTVARTLGTQKVLLVAITIL